MGVQLVISRFQVCPCKRAEKYDPHQTYIMLHNIAKMYHYVKNDKTNPQKSTIRPIQ